MSTYSYSKLLLYVQTLSDAATSDLCASFQAVAFQHVEDRLKHALNYVDDHQLAVTSLVVVGGVAANKELRRYKFFYSCNSVIHHTDDDNNNIHVYSLQK